MPGLPQHHQMHMFIINAKIMSYIQIRNAKREFRDHLLILVFLIQYDLSEDKFPFGFSFILGDQEGLSGRIKESIIGWR